MNDLKDQPAPEPIHREELTATLQEAAATIDVNLSIADADHLIGKLLLFLEQRDHKILATDPPGQVPYKSCRAVSSTVERDGPWISPLSSIQAVTDDTRGLARHGGIFA